MKKKILSLMLSLSITASFAAFSPVIAAADTGTAGDSTGAVSGETYTQNVMLENNKTYSGCTVNGDITITVNQGESVYMDNLIIESGNVRISGGGTIYQNEDTNYAITVNDGAHLTLENITIDGKNSEPVTSKISADMKSLIYMQKGSTLDIEADTVLQNNIAYSGGGIVCSGGTITMTGGTIKSNSSNSGGGIDCSSSGTITMTGGTIEGNSAENYGGGIDGGVVSIEGGTIKGNSAYYGGGIRCSSSGTITMTNGTIDSNTANLGGGIYCYDGTFIMSNGLIKKNRAEKDGNYRGEGGGIYCNMSMIKMTGGIIESNTADVDGGGICSIDRRTNNTTETAVISNAVICNNEASDGSGILCNNYSGSFIMEDVLVYGNKTTSNSIYFYDIESIGQEKISLKSGLILGTVDPEVKLGSLMRKGIIEGLPASNADINDGTYSVPNANNGDTLCARSPYISVGDQKYFGSYANNKWDFGDGVTPAPVITISADAGYYAESRNADQKEGIISFNAVFTNYEDVKRSLRNCGMYIYGQTGTETNVNIGKIDNLHAAYGKFYATVENIPADKFDYEFTAKPYAVVIEGSKILSGPICTFTVNKKDKWLGVRPEQGGN